MTPCKVAIVEDNLDVLNHLRILIHGEGRFDVVMSESDPTVAAREMARHAPDVLITDLSMPHLTGCDLIRRVSPKIPALLPIVFTVHEDDKKVFEALEAGAVGYILKGSPPRELIEGIDLVLSGGSPMSPAIARKIISSFHKPPAEETLSLSAREIEVLRLVEEAHTYKKIGEKLFISPNTVHAHIKKIYEKLQAKNRSEALKIARSQSLI